MARRRDVLKYLGLSAALEPLLNEPGYAGEGTDPIESAVPATSRSPSRTTHIPFTLHGRPGRVAVNYGVTADPVAVGFGAIPKLGFDPTLCQGYPTMRAVIEAYGGSGYRTLCGWIQVVTGKYYRAGSKDTEPAETEVSVDKLPAMTDVDIPFAAFGNLPGLFDAPCRNLNGYERLRWTADSFLTTVPMRSRQEDVQRLAAFRWGYVEHDPSAHRPVAPLPLTVTDAGAWNDLLPYLRKTFTEWRFATAT